MSECHTCGGLGFLPPSWEVNAQAHVAPNCPNCFGKGDMMGDWEFAYVVFDGPPGPRSGRFIEVENDKGESISVGDWRERPDGKWELRLKVARNDD